MALPASRARRALLLTALLAAAVLAAFDLLQPDSYLRGLFRAEGPRHPDTREVVDDLKRSLRPER
ncbi:MAG: hypothetical protein D6701_11615 [Gemmatimonadetes bacterium]|nr:MAG: hypothetical protein D6701_11615 [Gemmatimonadota bacterium]